MNTFHINKANSNIALLLEVEKSLAENNTTQAAASNASIFPENTMEESYQQYYEALRHFEDSSFTIADSLILMNLVFGCPTLQGGSVIQAATLYNAVYQTAEVFENICPEYLDKKPIAVDESAAMDKAEAHYYIYPIPNKGSFYVKGEMKMGYSVLMLNTFGSVVHQTKINEETDEQHVQTNLASGTYVVVLKDAEGNEVYREKIVVIQ